MQNRTVKTIPAARLPLPEPLMLHGQLNVAQTQLLRMERQRLDERASALQLRLDQLGLMLQAICGVPDHVMPHLQVNFDQGFVLVPEYSVEIPGGTPDEEVPAYDTPDRYADDTPETLPAPALTAATEIETTAPTA